MTAFAGDARLECFDALNRRLHVRVVHKFYGGRDGFISKHLGVGLLQVDPFYRCTHTCLQIISGSTETARSLHLLPQP